MAAGLLWCLWLFVVSLAAFTPISSGQMRYSQPGNVTLGVVLPLHVKTAQDKCGEFYTFGLGYVEAITYTIKRINDQVNFLPNMTLGFDIRDYCDTPVLAMKVANELVTNNYLNELFKDRNNISGPESLMMVIQNMTAPVSAVIGTEDSSSSTLVASLLQVADIPTVSPFATSEELSSPYFSSFFRTIPPDGEQAKAMVDIIEFFEWKHVAAVAVDHSYGRYGLRALEREAYDRQTFCIAFSEYFTRSGYKGKIKAIVSKLKRAEHIKVIVLWSNYEPAKRFLMEASAQRLTGRTFLFSEAMSTLGPDVLDRHASVLEGALGISPHLFRDRGFESHLKTLTPNATRHLNNPWWEVMWRTHFNCSSQTNDRDGIRPCEKNRTIGDRIFSRMHNPFIPYLMDAVQAIAHALDDILKCKEPRGLLRNGECPQTRPNVKPQDTLQYLRKTSFTGITGPISFRSTGDPVASSYDIINFQRVESFHANVKVGSWHQGDNPKLFVNKNLIRWSNGSVVVPVSRCSKTCPPGTKQTAPIACCWECIQCQEGSISSAAGSSNCTKCSRDEKSNEARTKCIPLPISNIGWTSATAVFLSLLTVLGLLLTSFTVGVFFKKQDTPIVKASNRELSFLLLLCIALCFLLTFLTLALPTDALCCVVQPWRYLTCTACVSILFLKTNRLVRAFQTNLIPAWFKRYVVDRKRQFLVVFLLNVVEISLTILWLALDPPYQYKDIVTQQHVFLACKSFRTSTGSALRAVIFSYFIFLSILCTFYAFKARRLPENFNEAKYIGFAMYILLVSWIAFYPVDSALEGYYITIVGCSTALFTAYGLLLCMFAPKVFVILLHPEQNTVDFVKVEIGHFATGGIVKAATNRVNPTSINTPEENTAHSAIS